MPRGQAVGGAVEADVKGRLSAVDKLADKRLVGHLRDKTSFFEFFVNSHIYSPYNFFLIKTPSDL